MTEVILPSEWAQRSALLQPVVNFDPALAPLNHFGLCVLAARTEEHFLRTKHVQNILNLFRELRGVLEGLSCHLIGQLR